MYYQKSTKESEKHVLGVILGLLSNAVVRFFCYMFILTPFAKLPPKLEHIL